MPANLSPEYKESEEKYRHAQTAQEQLVALQEMLATIPKHKGTEKMQADIKRRISKLKQEMVKRSGAKRAELYVVEKEGIGQFTLVGPPNSGKSSLLRLLTNADAKVGEYPYTTQLPQPGMAQHEDVQIQVVDLPPVSDEFSENWIYGLIRISDGCLLVIDLSSDDLLHEVDMSMNLMEEHRIKLHKPGERVELEDRRWSAKPCLLIGMKYDSDKAIEHLDIFKEFYGPRFEIFTTSTIKTHNIKEIITRMYEMLGVIRLYAKQPGKPPDMSQPFVLKTGSTILDLAGEIHNDFVTNFRFAKVWGSAKFDGQKVNKDYILQDGDVVEFHVA